MLTINKKNLIYKFDNLSLSQREDVNFEVKFPFISSLIPSKLSILSDPSLPISNSPLYEIIDKLAQQVQTLQKQHIESLRKQQIMEEKINELKRQKPGFINPNKKSLFAKKKVKSELNMGIEKESKSDKRSDEFIEIKRKISKFENEDANYSFSYKNLLERTKKMKIITFSSLEIKEIESAWEESELKKKEFPHSGLKWEDFRNLKPNFQMNSMVDC